MAKLLPKQCCLRKSPDAAAALLGWLAASVFAESPAAAQDTLQGIAGNAGAVDVEPGTGELGRVIGFIRAYCRVLKCGDARQRLGKRKSSDARPDCAIHSAKAVRVGSVISNCTLAHAKNLGLCLTEAKCCARGSLSRWGPARRGRRPTQ
jgi:hypothetical protein